MVANSNKSSLEKESITYAALMQVLSKFLVKYNHLLKSKVTLPGRQSYRFILLFINVDFYRPLTKVFFCWLC